jgi:ribose transport system substrate-binding protein
VKLSPQLVLRTCVLLLILTVAGGLAGNLSIIRRPLLAAANPVRGPEAPLRFLLVAPLQDHPFWQQVAQGAREAAEQLHVGVELTAPRHASVEEDLQLLDMATAAQVDGIITQGVADPRVGAAIAKAADRGIPVITLETDLPEGATARRLAYVGTDNYQAGRLAAEELVLRTGGKAIVGIVRGHFGPEAQDLRIAGFRDVLARYPGINIVAVESSDLNRNVAGQKALQMLETHPEVTALYATTALDAVGVAQAVTAKQRRNRILVVAWGSAGEWDDPTLRGVVQVAVVQDPVAMGRRAVQVLEAYLRQDVRPATAIAIPVIIRSGGGSW